MLLIRFLFLVLILCGALVACQTDCPVHHVALVRKTVYGYDGEQLFGTSKELTAFDKAIGESDPTRSARFPYATLWTAGYYYSSAPTKFYTRKTELIYCPECEKSIRIAWAAFDKQWKKTHKVDPEDGK